MNSSAKFFDPIVRVTLPFDGSDLISPPLWALGLPPAVDELELEPQAATSADAATAVTTATEIRTLLALADTTIPFPRFLPRVGGPAWNPKLGPPRGALQPQTLRGQ